MRAAVPQDCARDDVSEATGLMLLGGDDAASFFSGLHEGGGIQNELLVQLTADALGREVVAGPIEGTIAGNIGVQAMASGLVKDLQAWRGVVARSFRLKMYSPSDAQYFNDHEGKFEAVTRGKRTPSA